jgi:hypothetical protein
MKKEDLKLLHHRIAHFALGPSTLWNQGAKGVLKKAREHLKGVHLKYFSKKTCDEFRRALDKETERLRKNLPKGAQNWGAARKALNIFLRDVLYNYHLSTEYRLRPIEKWLEVPLESYVATALKKTHEGKDLPRWGTIKHLTKEDLRDAPTGQIDKLSMPPWDWRPALISEKLCIASP